MKDKEKYIDKSWRAKMVEKGLYKDSEITSEEKQIEEMANIIDDCTWVTDENYCESISCEECHAKRLYEHGYRKLPEDSVVLSKEEYERLKSLPNKIIKYMDRHLGDGELSGNILRNCAKQFGVEIKEA